MVVCSGKRARASSAILYCQTMATNRVKLNKGIACWTRWT